MSFIDLGTLSTSREIFFSRLAFLALFVFTLVLFSKSSLVLFDNYIMLLLDDFGLLTRQQDHHHLDSSHIAFVPIHQICPPSPLSKIFNQLQFHKEENNSIRAFQCCGIYVRHPSSVVSLVNKAHQNSTEKRQKEIRNANEASPSQSLRWPI